MSERDDALAALHRRLRAYGVPRSRFVDAASEDDEIGWVISYGYGSVMGGRLDRAGYRITPVGLRAILVREKR